MPRLTTAQLAQMAPPLCAASKDTYRTPTWIVENAKRIGPVFLDTATGSDNPLGAEHTFTLDNPAPEQTKWPTPVDTGQIAFQNHPYSKNREWVAPFVGYCARAPVVGMLLANASAGTEWHSYATANCQLVATFNKRLAFIDPATGRPATGNQWGSSIWLFCHPSRTATLNIFNYVWRDYATITKPVQYGGNAV